MRATNITNGVLQRFPLNSDDFAVSPNGRVAMKVDNQHRRLIVLDLLYGCKRKYRIDGIVSAVAAVSEDSAIFHIKGRRWHELRLVHLSNSLRKSVQLDMEELPLDGINRQMTLYLSNNGAFLWSKAVSRIGNVHCYAVSDRLSLKRVFTGIAVESSGYRVDGESIFYFSNQRKYIKKILVFRTNWTQTENTLVWSFPTNVEFNNWINCYPIWLDDRPTMLSNNSDGTFTVVAGVRGVPLLAAGQQNDEECVRYSFEGLRSSVPDPFHRSAFSHTFHTINSVTILSCYDNVNNFQTVQHWHIRKPESLLNLTTRIIATNWKCKIVGYNPNPLPICDTERCDHLRWSQCRYEWVRRTPNQASRRPRIWRPWFPITLWHAHLYLCKVARQKKSQSWKEFLDDQQSLFVELSESPLGNENRTVRRCHSVHQRKALVRLERERMKVPVIHRSQSCPTLKMIPIK